MCDGLGYSSDTARELEAPNQQVCCSKMGESFSFPWCHMWRAILAVVQ